MKSAKDPRHIARIMAVMDLYRFFFAGEELPEYNFDDFELGTYSKKIYDSLTQGVKDTYSKIDELIDAHSQPVKSADLDNLVLQIIRVAVYEGFTSKSVPPKVAVDEAIELTRDFGLELSSRKVSGILGKIFESTKQSGEKELKE